MGPNATTKPNTPMRAVTTTDTRDINEPTTQQLGTKMTNAQLLAFRAIADAMTNEPTNWEWVGAHMSQRMFGITETRAKAYASRHGGVARKMEA